MLTEAHTVDISELFLFTDSFPLIETSMLNGKHFVTGCILMCWKSSCGQKTLNKSDKLDQVMSTLLSDPGY
jgi:hypothetical protein